MFANVTADMEIAREEVFGPVLVIMGYRDVEEVIRISNDSIYDLSGYVSGANKESVRYVASHLRTGMIHINGAPGDMYTPFEDISNPETAVNGGGSDLKTFWKLKLSWGTDHLDFAQAWPF